MRWYATHITPAVASALLAVLSGCASAPPQTMGSAGQDTPAPLVPEPVSRLTQEQANDVTVQAISLVGTPYKWGGNTPESGFDCSGLIAYVYKSRAGIASPRTVAALSDWGQAIQPAALRAGDLVLFTQKGVAKHAGIYVGEGRFVHAPSTGGEVRLDALNSKYWAKQTVGYRRP